MRDDDHQSDMVYEDFLKIRVRGKVQLSLKLIA
jgi:hypothetical protein